MTRKASRPAPALPKSGEGKRGVDGHLAYLLRQASAAVRQTIEARLSPTGLTHPQFVTLTMLRAYGPLSGAELARLSALTPQTIGVITANLERMEAVQRAAAVGRVVRFSITPQGGRLLGRAKRRVDAVERGLAAGLPPSDEAAVRRWLVTAAALPDQAAEPD